MAGWFLPTAAYVVIVGSLGVTTKFALREMSWQELILWTTVAYVVIACILLVLGTPARFHGGFDGFCAAISALIFPVAGILFAVALTHGATNRVVPVTSTYPLVTVLLSAAFLAEDFTLARLLGALLIVAGVIVVSV